MGGPRRPANGLSKADWQVAAGIALFWVCLHALSGTLTSGYHFQDDHELLRISADLKADGFATVAQRWAATDLAIRFRPLYYIHRVAEAAVLGDNLFAWSTYAALWGMLSSCLLYLSFKVLGFSTLEALAFAFFSLVGVQSTVWWRLGPSETIGMGFLSLTSFALAWQARTGSRTARVLTSVFAVSMSLCKESFVLLIPALLFARVWIERKGRNTTWRDAAGQCRAELAALLAVVLAELLVIRLFVGTERIGYAGVEGITSAQVLASGSKIATFAHLWVVIVAMSALTSLASRSAAVLRAILPALALCGLIIAPQVVLYAKSGVFERYHLPGVIGVAFLLSWCMRHSREQRPRPRTWASPLAVTALLLAVLGFAQARSMYRSAASFAEEGRAQQGFVDEVAASCRGGPVMIAGGMPGVYEHFWSIHFYLKHRANRERDVYFHFVRPDGPLSAFDEGIVRNHQVGNGVYKPFDATRAPPEFTCVGVLDGEEKLFLARAAGWFEPGSYERRAIGKSGYAVYARR